MALLAHHFIQRFAEEEGKLVNGISANGLNALERYRFPGNVRELQNIIRRAMVVATGTSLDLKDLPPVLRAGMRLEDLSQMDVGFEPNLESLTQAFDVLFPSSSDLLPSRVVEAALFRHSLRLHEGNVAAAATALGISRATAYRRIQELGGKKALMDTT